MTEHTCTKHEPGTTTCYHHHACRCVPCRRAATKARQLRELRGGYQPALGSTRRLRALVAAGWTLNGLERVLDVSRPVLSRLLAGRLERVCRVTHETIRSAYMPLSDGPKDPDPRSIERARREGWGRPIDWDDDQMDNPDADQWRPPKRDDLIDAIADAATLGYNLHEAAAALDRKPDSIYQACRRAGELEWYLMLRDRVAS